MLKMPNQMKRCAFYRAEIARQHKPQLFNNEKLVSQQWLKIYRYEKVRQILN